MQFEPTPSMKAIWTEVQRPGTTIQAVASKFRCKASDVLDIVMTLEEHGYAKCKPLPLEFVPSSLTDHGMAMEKRRAKVLRALKKFPQGVSTMALAESMNCSLSYVVKAGNGLIERGLAKRCPLSYLWMAT